MTVRAIDTWSGLLDLWWFMFVDSLKMTFRCRNI